MDPGIYVRGGALYWRGVWRPPKIQGSVQWGSWAGEEVPQKFLGIRIFRSFYKHKNGLKTKQKTKKHQEAHGPHRSPEKPVYIKKHMIISLSLHALGHTNL